MWRWKLLLKDKKMIKLFVPIVIILAIVSIWFVKNQGEAQEQADMQIQTEAQVMDSVATLLEATDLDLAALKSYGLPIMIDFGADSCIPCKEMAPVLKSLNEEYQGRVIVKFVDVWKYPDLAKDFPVQVIPTQFFFDENGQPFVPINPQAMGMEMYELQADGQHVFTAHQGGMTKEQILEVFRELGVEN